MKREGNQRRVGLIAVLVLSFLAVLLLILVRRQHEPVETAYEQDVREIRAAISGYDRAILFRHLNTLSLGMAGHNFRAMTLKEQEVIRPTGNNVAFAYFTDGFNSNLTYNYQLERRTNGWVVVGSGTRSR